LLLSKGYDVWIDRRNIGAGSRWDQSIEEAITVRSHMLVLLSPESAASQNVADEWNYAFEGGKAVIPIIYKACNMPMRLRRVQWIDFVEKDFAEAFSELIATLGPPDTRPSDRIELARREGLVFIELPGADIRIAFIYSDYPFATAFIKTVWFCLLWTVIPRGSTQDVFYDYGTRWFLRNKITGETYNLPQERQRDLLFHEIGIEPNSELEVIIQ
jgi:hypothetical protein